MATENVKLIHECFRNTCAWEQQEWNKTKTQRKKVRKEEWTCEVVQRVIKKKTRLPNCISGLKYSMVKKKAKFSMASSPQWRIYFHCLWDQLSTTSSNGTEVAVNMRAGDHSHLRTMASEPVVSIISIHWPSPPPFTGQYSLSATCNVQMRATNHKCSQWDANAWHSEH